MDVLIPVLLLLLIAFGLYLLALLPACRPKNYRPRSALYAHRGFHDMRIGIPENSLTAFSRARAFGYGVELDVQLTKDKKPVVFHDETLLRMCGIDRKVRDCTYDQLLKYNLSETGERIPLLEEALHVLGNETPIICEIKVYGQNNDMEICQTILPLLMKYKKNLVVESFNPFAVLWFRRHAPMIIRGQLSCNFRRSNDGPNRFVGFVLQHLIFNFITLPHFVAYRCSDKDCISFRLMRKLYDPLTAAWTIRSEKEQAIACRNQFHIIIFEGYQPTAMQFQKSK